MTTDISIVVTGLDALMREVGTSDEQAKRAMAIALYEEGAAAFAESQIQCPVEFGTLQSSGTLYPPVITPEGADVLITYGGAASEYAVYVHEILENHHVPPTKAKFLEDPVIAQAIGMGERMSVRVAALLGGWP